MYLRNLTFDLQRFFKILSSDRFLLLDLEFMKLISKLARPAACNREGGGRRGQRCNGSLSIFPYEGGQAADPLVAPRS